MKNNRALAITALTVAVLVCACNGNGLTPAEFKQHIENADNGFVQSVQVNGFSISCMYTPSEYMAVRAFGKNDIPREAFKTQQAAFSAFDMYSIEVSASDPRNLAGLSEYFGYFLQNDVYKVCGTDTLPCTLYHGEPYNGIDKKQHIEIGFENKTCSSPYETVLLQSGPLSTALILFPFEKNKLSIPALSLN